jgi:hypothetical protein
MSGRNYSLGEWGSRGNGKRGGDSKRRVMWIGRVVESDDPEAAGRVKVRIKGLDDKKSNSELPYAWPFLPLYLNIIPKKNETVKIILYDAKNEDSYREYVGPIIPQIGEKLIGAENFDEAKAGREGVRIPFSTSIKKIETAKDDLYPKEDEIAIQGRNNSDLIFKDSEVLIRAGKFLPLQPNVKNNVNPGYIQIKTIYPKRGKKNPVSSINTSSAVKELLTTLDYKETRTDVNLLGNKIYLIGRDSNSSIIKPYPTEQEQSEIEKRLHPIVYGDILKDFIDKVYNWIRSHSHPYHNVPQNPADPSFLELQQWVTFELPNLLSKNIFAGGDVPTKESLNIKLSNKNEDVKTKLIRFNADEISEEEINEPPFYIESNKLCTGNNCETTFKLVNKVNGKVLNTIKGSGNTELDSYTDAVNKLNSLLDSLPVINALVKIPQLNEIKIF